jgi:cytidylate kinase
MVADGEDVSFEQVLENVRERDVNDQRQWAPLLESNEAIVIDTTRMTLTEVLERLRQEVMARMAG